MKIGQICKGMLALLLTLSVLAVPCIAFSVQNGEEIKDISFATSWDQEKGQMIKISPLNMEDEKAILLIAATERKDGGLKLLDLKDEAADGSISGVSASGVIVVENYDGSPYEFSASGLSGEGNISAILLGENNISMGTIEYSFTDEYFSLGEEREIEKRIEGSSPLLGQEDLVFFQYANFGEGYKAFINFSGATKDGILLVFAENDKELHSFDGGWLGDDTKVRCVEDFQGGDYNMYSLPAEELGTEDGNLCVVIIDKEEGPMMTTMGYSPSGSSYFDGKIGYMSKSSN